MKQQNKLTLLLCGVWVVTLLYGEMFAYWVPSFWACSWPHLRPSISTRNGAMYPRDYKKVAVLTDPQLMDSTSLHLPSKSLALEIAQFYADLYMRRAFFASILPFRPDVIVFLGDYFDGGPYLSDEEWQESLQRFRHIFDLNAAGRLADIQVYFIPGNHDIGYENVYFHKPEVIRRYEKEFGIRNYRFTIGKVEFIAVDAQTLDGHLLNNLSSMSWEFVKNVSNDIQSIPRVLLTHIPLFRRDNTYCGRLRKSPVINQRILRSAHDQDIMYQNYATEESSIKVLEQIGPTLILSGHDHDQCTVIHESKFGPVTEHTIGTISWQQGNLYPSFMLLSAAASLNGNGTASEGALMTEICFLPMQTHIYLWYISLFFLTILTLLLWSTGINFGRHLSGFMDYIKLYGRMFEGITKEKNEDEDFEYEMLWDADGSMHLVKKPRDTPISRLNDGVSVERGNTLTRPTARKTFYLETEVVMNVDTSADIGHDPVTKLRHKTNKSRLKIIFLRLMRAFQMIMVIAAVNVSLYMMMLFKDWIK